MSNTNSLCSIVHCPNRNVSRSQYHLHGLPKDENTKDRWLEFIAKENNQTMTVLAVTKNLQLCGGHFAERDKGIKKLRRNAIPTISLPNVVDDGQPGVDVPNCSLIDENCRKELPVVAEVVNVDVSDSDSCVLSEISKSSSLDCCILFCESKAINSASEGFRLHRLPKDVTFRNLWCHWIAHQNNVLWTSLIGKSLFVCSKHFVNSVKGKVKLKKNAVPSITVAELTSAVQFSLKGPSTSQVVGLPHSIVDMHETIAETSFDGGEISMGTTAFGSVGTCSAYEDILPCTVPKESKPDSFLSQKTVIPNGYESYSSVIEIDMSSTDQINDFPGTTWNLYKDVFGEEVETVFIDEVLSKSLQSCNISTEEGNLHKPSSLSAEVMPAHDVPLQQQEVCQKPKEKQRSEPNRHKCSAKECLSLPGKKYFTFPATMPQGIEHQANIERCKIWVQNSGNESLLNEPTSRLHSKYYLCGDHFANDQFYNRDRISLLPSAIPTVFNHGHPINDLEMEKYPVLTTEEHYRGIEAQDMDPLQLAFEYKMSNFKWNTCNSCHEKFYVQAESLKICLHSRNICPTYSAENDMDPGVVPTELKGLTYVEEQLIARVHPLISIFKLKGNIQFGYRGNVINFPQNVKHMASQLPHRIEDLSSLITIRTSDEVNPVDFYVRAGKVKQALQWLQANNPFYTDIQFSEENFRTLPENSNVFERVSCVIDDGDMSEQDFQPTAHEEDEYHSSISETCVPMMGEPSQKDKAAAVLNWPHISKECINEFNTVGYIAMAFPCLFPYGKADLRSPREKKISPINYFNHLMKYEDERFAKHPRFRYFALNSVMRWSALQNGGVFVKKNSEFRNMKKKDLKEKLDEDQSFLRKMMFYNSNLRGTKAYWHTRGQQLLAMVQQLGLPTLFFTLSAADLHWPDLFKFLVDADEDVNTLTESRRRKLIAENPGKVDAFFMERSDAFITQVVCKKYKVNDMWYRVEYQHRGSPHIHGVLWLDGAPKFEDLCKASDEEKEVIEQYFDTLISTNHPNPGCSPAITHPCRIRLSDVVDLKRDLAELLNRVQLHTKCSESYCLRKNKKSKKKECRFKFPKNYNYGPTKLEISEDKDVQLNFTRNHRYLNKYNEYMIQTWRANIDVSPVLSKRALVTYLAKYISKSETQSKDLLEILKTLVNNSEDDASAKSIIQRLYIQSCAERDYSAQETCHFLMGLPLCSAGGRKFVTLNFKVLDSDGWVPAVDDNSNQGKSYIEKYMERPKHLENECLMQLAKDRTLPGGRRHAYGKQAIVQVFPKLSHINKENAEVYYRQKVLLYIPWRYEEQFLDKYFSWENAYKANEARIIQMSEVACDVDNVNPEISEYEEAILEESSMTEEFMYVARMGPSQQTEQIELGRRDIDKNFNWQEASQKYAQYGNVEELKSFVQDKKREATDPSFNTTSEIPVMPDVQFTSEQETVLKLLKLQIESIKNNESFNQPDFALPKSVIVQGKAGTGKSLLIHAMQSLIWEAFGEDSCMLLGPTGVSAVNINGSTIHSKLHMHFKSSDKTLQPAALHEFRQKNQNKKFVIIDEYSMVGCGMLNNIDKRLKEAMDRDDLPFGGVYVYLFGDIQQLAPVGDSPVYSDNQESQDYINGKLLYKSVDGSISLSNVKRQNDIAFQSLLNNICTGSVTTEDYKILKKRFTTSLSLQEQEKFKDAIHLYPTRKEVELHNCNMLQKLNIDGSPVPIARVPARHNIPAAFKGTENEAEGLRPVLYLAPGCKIMLRANLWTEKGLVNGAIGTVVDILYSEGSNPPDDPPVAIVCTFKTYKGPYLDSQKKTVVIQPLIKRWKNKEGQECIREQFPISVCYACSIHKAQGLTLEKAFINIGIVKEMSPGLTYTALSRVKSLSGLMLDPFGFKRIQSLNSKQYIINRQEWIDELKAKSIINLFMR